MKMQNSGEPRGSTTIMIRYIINKNALSKDFTPFCDENCKNWTQAIVKEDVLCIFFIPSNMQRLKCTYGYLIDCCKRE